MSRPQSFELVSSPWRTSRRAACQPRNRPSSCHAPPCHASTSETRQAAHIPRPRTCSQRHAPAILGCRAARDLPHAFLSGHSPSPPPSRPLPPSPPQTLAQTSIAAAAWSSAGRRDSPSPVSRGSIPRGGSFSSLSSFDSPPYPAPSSPLQGRRRAPSPAATRRHCAATSPPFPAIQAPGEARRHLLHPVRPRPEPLRPCIIAPPWSRHPPCLDPA